MRYLLLDYLISIYPLIAGLTGMLTAQFLKTLFFYIREDRLDLKKALTTGGMPSSHTAMVAALTTGVGLKDGWSSTLFCMSMVFSLIVVYDAAGIRRAAGRQAAVLNKMMDDFMQGKFHGEHLTELLGHTPMEVLAGMLLGIGVAFTLYY